MKRFVINTSIVVILGLGIALALVWVLGSGGTPIAAAPRAEGDIEAPNAPAAPSRTQWMLLPTVT